MRFGNSSKDSRLKAKLWVVWGRGNAGRIEATVVCYLRKSSEKEGRKIGCVLDGL